MLLFLLHLSFLGAAVSAPVVAAAIVYRAPKPRPSPFANWLGLSIAGELGAALACYTLFIGLQGPWHWPYYYLAYLFVAAEPMLAFFAAREHLRGLRGRRAAARGLGFACLGLAALVAAALIPWILGAPLPFDGGRSGMRFTLAANVYDYAWVVLPITAAMEVEAWLLIGRPGSSAREAGAGRQWTTWLASIGVAVLALGTILLLTGSRWDSRHVAKLERAAVREQAEKLDAPRRQALAEIVAGRAPSLLAEPCPVEATPKSWRGWERFAAAPKDWDALLRQANEWQGLEVVSLWRPGRNVDGTPRIRTGEESSQIADSSPSGPRRRAIFARLDDERWNSRLFIGDLVVAPEAARGDVRASAAEGSWDVDATLIVLRETISFAVQGRTNLGSLAGTLWVWNYREQAFVCAGEARVPHAEMTGGFNDPQAHSVRDSIRMRALAQAVGALRAVERRQ